MSVRTRSERKSAQPSLERDVQFITYNILSSKLADPKTFKQCAKENLDKDVRMERIKTKLTPYLKNRAVVALQEVSREFLCALMPFLGFHGYSVSSSNYGVWYNDFMGCLIAYPRELELESMHISRVARTKSWPRAPPPTRVQRAKDFLNPVGWVRSALALPGQTKHYVHSKIAGVLGLKTPKKVRDDSKADPWALAMKRENTAVMVRLKKQGVGGSFVVATYHMPCLYYCPPTMSIHASLVVKAVQKWAGGDPYVLMGDFNFMPSGDAYSLVTTGSLPEGSAGLPAYPNPNDPWRIDLEQTVTSAYVLKNKEDPEISYYSRMWGKPMFEDTLDYIFLPSNSDMEVVSVVPVLTKADLKDCDSLPDQDEPSDHLLLGATLRMPLIQ